MKPKRLLLAATLVLGLAAAEAVDTRGLPAEGAGGFLFISVRKLDESKIGTALDKAFGDEVRASVAFRTLKDKLGLDLEKDLGELALCFYAHPDGPSPDVVGVLHGRFDVAKIEAFARSAKVGSRPAGKFTAWNADELGRALDPGKQPNAGPVPYLIFTGPDTALLAVEATLPAAVDAYAGAKPSYRLPPGIAARLDATEPPFILADFDVAALKQPPDQNGLLHGVLTLGEVGPNLVLGVDATMNSEAKATQLASQIKGMAGLFSLGLMDESNKTPEQLVGQRALLELIQSLKAEGKGDHAVLSISYDAEKAAIGLIKAAVAQQAKAKAGAAGK